MSTDVSDRLSWFGFCRGGEEEGELMLGAIKGFALFAISIRDGPLEK